MAHLSGVHDTCRRSLETTVTESVVFNISSAGKTSFHLIKNRKYKWIKVILSGKTADKLI